MPSTEGEDSSESPERSDATIPTEHESDSDSDDEDTPEEQWYMRIVLRLRLVNGEWRHNDGEPIESSDESSDEDSESDEDDLELWTSDLTDEETGEGTEPPASEEARHLTEHHPPPNDFSYLPVADVDQEMIDSELICAICLGAPEVGDIVASLICRHIFHKACITEWLSQTPTCPLCRRIAVPPYYRNPLLGYRRNNVSSERPDIQVLDRREERHVHWAFLTTQSAVQPRGWQHGSLTDWMP